MCAVWLCDIGAEQKWSKGKSRDKVANKIAFDEELYPRFVADVPKVRNIWVGYVAGASRGAMSVSRILFGVWSFIVVVCGCLFALGLRCCCVDEAHHPFRPRGAIEDQRLPRTSSH